MLSIDACPLRLSTSELHNDSSTKSHIKLVLDRSMITQAAFESFFDSAAAAELRELLQQN